VYDNCKVNFSEEKVKKFLVCLFVVTALACLSCQTGPTVSGVRIDGEVTQQTIDRALGQIYDAYRARLDLTGAQEYTVQRGDTLSEITRRFYGNLTNVGNAGARNGFYFPLIMVASDHVIVDPDLIEPGMRLVVPDLTRNLANQNSRRAIKDLLNDVAYVYNRRGQTANEQGLLTLANSL
jgi:hypothetical protein